MARFSALSELVKGGPRRENEIVNGREFVRRARRYARRTGQDFVLDTRRGKGSHMAVYIGSQRTFVKYGEISQSLLFSMLRQLDINREEF